VPPYIICTKKSTYGGVNQTMSRYYGVDEKVLKHIANAYRLVFHSKTSLFDAVNQIEEQVPDSVEIRNIIQFLRSTQIGVISKI
jgi:UDP-N-acetylglucosamine acyltransferase